MVSWCRQIWVSSSVTVIASSTRKVGSRLVPWEEEVASRERQRAHEQDVTFHGGPLACVETDERGP